MIRTIVALAAVLTAAWVGNNWIQVTKYKVMYNAAAPTAPATRGDGGRGRRPRGRRCAGRVRVERPRRVHSRATLWPSRRSPPPRRAVGRPAPQPPHQPPSLGFSCHIARKSSISTLPRRWISYSQATYTAASFVYRVSAASSHPTRTSSRALTRASFTTDAQPW